MSLSFERVTISYWSVIIVLRLERRLLHYCVADDLNLPKV